MDLFDRIMELSRYGYFCGQILAILTLETVGEENPGLVRAMGGLNGGVGFSQGCCGCMTGGACVISWFTGKGEDTGMDHPEHKSALESTAATSRRATPPTAWSSARRSSPRPMRSAWKF